MPHTGTHAQARSAGEVQWQALRAIIYPWPDGVYLALERRTGVGTTHRDERLLAGPVELPTELDVDDLPSVLRACSAALARAADKMEPKRRRTGTDSPA
jgi:hypothetical protein